MLTGRTVTGIDADERDRRRRAHRRARTVVWAAGVTASSLAARLAELTGAERDRAGRVTVEPDLTLPGHPEVFALGDMVRVGDDGVLPGVAPVAMQQGRYAARVVRDRLRGKETPPFRYRDKGNLATIGKAAAVADIKGLKLSGFIAWITWLVVHLWYLVGFQNRDPRLHPLVRQLRHARPRRAAHHGFLVRPRLRPPARASARRNRGTSRSSPSARARASHSRCR